MITKGKESGFVQTEGPKNYCPALAGSRLVIRFRTMPAYMPVAFYFKAFPLLLLSTHSVQKNLIFPRNFSLSIEFKKSCSDDATSASSRHYQRAFGMKMEWKNLMPSVLSIEPADEDKGTGEKLTDDVEPGANYKYKLSHWSFNIVYCIIQNNIILFWRESIKKYTHSSFDHRKKII